MSTKPQDEKIALCLRCRRSFTEQEVAGTTTCPGCGDKGVPADPRKTVTITLTTHEWRILCIWAHRWAAEKVKEDVNVIDGIVGAIRQQKPDMPPLTMAEEFMGVKKMYPGAKLYDEDGNEQGGNTLQ